MASKQKITVLPAEDAAPVAIVAAAPADIAAPVETAPAVDIGGVTRTVDAGTVSNIAVERIERQRRALVDIFGETAVRRTDPVYPAGSVVNDTGVRNFRIERQKLEAMPNGVEAAQRTLARITREQRGEETIDLSLVDWNDDGSVRVNGRDVDLTPTAWQHLFSMAPNAPKYAAIHATHASARVRAAMVSDYLPRESKQLVLATREGTDANGNRLARTQGYRLASERYTPFDADMVLSSLLSTSADLMQGWKGDIRYDGERLGMDFLSMPDHVVDLAAGDVFKIGLRLRASDVRDGAITAELLAFRNRCLNLIIIGELGHQLFNLRHVGQAMDIHVALSTAFAEAEVKFGAFRHDWGIARSEIVIGDKFGPQDFFLGLAKANVLSLPGKAENIADTLLHSWLEEEGNTRADVVNAVTRAVHENTRWANAFDFETVEREAGSLLTDKRLISKVELALAA